MTPTVPRGQLNLAIPVANLLKGVVYRDNDQIAWAHLMGLTPRVRDYVATIGLDVVIDEGQGFAYLRSLPEEELSERGIPRLVPRHRLTRNATMLLVLLRKRLLEFDATDSGTRLVLGGDAIRAMMSPFMPTGDSEARGSDKIDAAISAVVKAGFVRKLPGQDDQYEVRRIITALVTADWLADTGRHFAALANGEEPADEPMADPLALDNAADDQETHQP